MCSRFRLFLYYKYKTDIKQAHYNQSALRFVEWHERGRAMHSGKVLCTQSSLVTAVNADRPAPDSQLRRSDTWVKKCMRIRQFHNNQTWQTNGWPQQKLPEFGFSAHTLLGLPLISVFLKLKGLPCQNKSIYLYLWPWSGLPFCLPSLIVQWPFSLTGSRPQPGIGPGLYWPARNFHF